MGKNPAQKAAQKAAQEDSGKKHDAKAGKGKKEEKEAVEAHAEHAAEEKKAHKVHKHHATSLARDKRHCKIKSCKRAYRAKGYCGVHYRKWRHGAYANKRYKSCGDVGCFRPMAMNRHGYCESHYQNYYVKGMAVAKVASAAAPADAGEDKKQAAG